MTVLVREVMRVIGGRSPADTERKISLVRLVILFALLPILWWDVVSPETELVLIALTALIAAYILAALLLLPRLRRELRKDLFLTIDVVAIAALVWYTGGIRSSLLFLFYFPILTAAVRLDLLQAILTAVGVSGIVVGMWTAAEGGLPSLGSTTLRVGLFAGGSVVLALFFGALARESRQLRERAELNRQLSERLTEATEQLHRRLGELEFAYDLSRRLAGTTDRASVLTEVADAARHLLRAPYGGVLLTDQMGREMVAACTGGVSDPEARPLLAACAGKVSADARDPATVEVDEPGVWTRAVGAPIVVGGQLRGVLCAGGGGRWEPARHSVAVLGQLAYQAGIALDRALLLEEVQRLVVARLDARVFDRPQFDRILRTEIARATQLGTPFALVKVAVKDVARVAAADGRKADLAHRRLTELVLQTARRGDVVAQEARGEVSVLLSMANLAAGRKFATRLLAQLHGDPTLSRVLGRPSALDVRAGIARFPEDAVGAAELTFAAQNALDATTPEHPVVDAHELESSQPPVPAVVRGESGGIPS